MQQDGLGGKLQLILLLLKACVDYSVTGTTTPMSPVYKDRGYYNY